MPFLQGTATAIATPFTSHGEIDFPALSRLVELQISQGIEAIVPCGSTGEAATLSVDERVRVIGHVVQQVGGRIRVIAGTGTNDTAATAKMTSLAKQLGADAVLVVCPFYNKPNLQGLLRHYSEVLDSADIPVIIYNVPGRTALNMSAETQLMIAELSNRVVATKESSGNLDQMMHIIGNAPAHFSLLAGDDNLALPAIASGATGLVSVLSNYAPKATGDLVRYALSGDLVRAREIHYGLLGLMDVNFIESNPAPVKAALHLLGFCENVLRLPLAPVSETSFEHIRREMTSAGLLVQ